MYIIKSIFKLSTSKFHTLLKFSRISCITSTSKYSVKSKRTQEELFDDGPIKYSKSPASKYKAKTTRSGFTYTPRLWYEPYVLIVSVAVFLIYFTMLREENDIDVELSQSLYSRISGLEEFQLKQSLQYNIQHGLETDAIIKRLKEIDAEKNEESES